MAGLLRPLGPEAGKFGDLLRALLRFLPRLCGEADPRGIGEGTGLLTLLPCKETWSCSRWSMNACKEELKKQTHFKDLFSNKKVAHLNQVLRGSTYARKRMCFLIIRQGYMKRIDNR